jgi:hypothetical protein
MIDIKVNLVPFGIEEHKREIAGIIIANDGTGSYYKGNYNVRFADGMDVRVEGHFRGDDIYHLLFLALKAREEKMAPVKVETLSEEKEGC